MSKKTPFYLFLLSSLVAILGSGMSSFAIGIYVFESTDSASAKAFISLLAFLPGLVLSPFAGTLADRFDRRRLMIASDALASMGIVLILLSFLMNFSSHPVIGLGVFLSSLFSSPLEPASRASISDLVEEKDYTRASGMIQMVGAARFLLAPLLATMIYGSFGLIPVLIFDIFTTLTTLFLLSLVEKMVPFNGKRKEEDFVQSFQLGLRFLLEKKPLLRLLFLSVIMSFSMGLIDELSTPMILSFSSSQKLGRTIAFAASGLVFGSLILGMKNLPPKKIPLLSLALFVAGLAMMGFGFKENILWIGFFGFLFFSSLPFANASLDFLVRINVPNALQGRVWGLIGIISQMGFVLAYALAGPLSDFVFRPLLRDQGPLAQSLGRVIGVGPGRGMGLLIVLGGLFLCLTSLGLLLSKTIASLDKGETYV